MAPHEEDLIRDHIKQLTEVRQQTQENTKDIKNLQDWSRIFQEETKNERDEFKEKLHSLERVVNTDINDIKISQTRLEGKFDALMARMVGREEATKEINTTTRDKLSLKYDEISIKYGKWMFIIGIIGLIFAFFGMNFIHI